MWLDRLRLERVHHIAAATDLIPRAAVDERVTGLPERSSICCVRCVRAGERDMPEAMLPAVLLLGARNGGVPKTVSERVEANVNYGVVELPVRAPAPPPNCYGLPTPLPNGDHHGAVASPASGFAQSFSDPARQVP